MEENIDIINKETGENTGEVKFKSEVHKDGLWHKTVHVWCVNSKGEILLQHRSKDKKNFPDMWDISVAGHISSGESSEQGALREIKEEIGIDISVSDLKYLGTVVQEFVLNNGTYIDNELNDVYIFKLEDNKDLKIQEEELDQLKWISIMEFEKWVTEKRSDLVPHESEYAILFKHLKEIK